MVLSLILFLPNSFVVIEKRLGYFSILSQERIVAGDLLTDEVIIELFLVILQYILLMENEGNEVFSRSSPNLNNSGVTGVKFGLFF